MRVSCFLGKNRLFGLNLSPLGTSFLFLITVTFAEKRSLLKASHKANTFTHRPCCTIQLQSDYYGNAGFPPNYSHMLFAPDETTDTSTGER